jgi:anti-sigma factor RsiW
VSGCAGAREQLAAREGELDVFQSRALAVHLAECDDCGAQAAAYRELSAGLAALATLEAEPPEELLDRLLALHGRHSGLAPFTMAAGHPVAAVAAGSAGALAVTIAVAGALRQRRRRAPVPVGGALAGLAAAK